MRTFYIFKIKKDISILNKDTPYNLFRIIDHLYYLDGMYLDIYRNMYGSIFEHININYVNKRIYNLFKNNKYYYFDGVIHLIDNKYSSEFSKLKVYKSHIILKTNQIKPDLLFNYLNNYDLFACDFKNKDYFWLNEIVRL